MGAPSNSPNAHGTIRKFGQERVHQEGSFRSVNLISVILAHPGSMRGHERSPLQQERCVRKAALDSAKNVYKLKIPDKATFYSPIEARATPPPTSKLPEDREFVIDSGASVHMLSKKVLSSDEIEALRRSRTPTVVVTANGGSLNKRGSTSIRSRS